MERSKDYVLGTSYDLEICVKNLPELLPILDVDELLTRIQAIYKDIIQKSPESASFFENFLDTPLMPSKSKDQADKYKEEAKVFLRAKKFREALLSITQCIAFAEEDSAELAAAYSHRSYILFQLKKYNACIQDVDRAAKLKNCPPVLEMILHKRREKCSKLQRRITTDEEENLHLEWRKSCNLRPSLNTYLPNTSLKLKLDFDERGERHLIAIEDIQPGEILSVEDFYATLLYPEKLYAHCSFCLLECDNLIPCSTCTREMYCSEDCQSQAFSLFHRSECKIRYYDHAEATIVTFLAFRMFLIGTEQGRQLEDLTKKLKPHDIFSRKYDHNFRFDDYRSTLQFRRIYQVGDDYIRVAVSIIIGLIQSSFFENIEVLPDRLSPVPLYATLFLINHLITLRMVPFTIEGLHFREDSPDTRCTERIPAATSFELHLIGFGISSLQTSLIKRSCYANTSTFHQNRQRIVFATRKIRAGEKLSTNSMIYKSPDRVKQYRVESGGQYTVCEIDACSTVCTKIELLEYKETPFSLYSSLKTEIMSQAVKACTEVRRAMTQAKVLRNKKILGVIIEHSNLLCKILATPSYSIVLCEQLLVVFMKLLYGEHQRQYKDLSLENYIINLLNFIARRIYGLKGTNFAPKN